MGWLEGDVALVTGGGSGIGRGIVERFISEGAKVAVLDRSEPRIVELREEFGNHLIGVVGDVTIMQDNINAVQECLDAFGKLDIFVGNAGIFDFRVSLADLPVDKIGTAFDELFGINVKGYLQGAKAALPELLKSRGCMIFTVSNAGFYPDGGGPLYTASKHAIVGLIRELAFELSPNVRVNGVVPGGTRTDLRGPVSLGQAERPASSVPREQMDKRIRSVTPLQIAAQPADHTGAYVLLASRNNSPAITGVVINSDGGLGVRGIFRVSGMGELD